MILPCQNKVYNNNNNNNNFVIKSLVPTESSQHKEKFSCPFQSTDNFPEWKLALRIMQINKDIRFGCQSFVSKVANKMAEYKTITTF